MSSIHDKVEATLHRDAAQHLIQIIMSWIFFECLVHQLNIWIGTLLPQSKTFSAADKDSLVARTSSFLHSLIVFPISLYCLMFDSASKENVLWGDSWLIRTNISISVGFFLSDMRYVLTHWGDGGFEYLAHHLSALWPYSLVAFTGWLSYFANFRILAELSTPFVNIRWYLAFTDLRDSPLYIYNGLIMTASFFVCRIVCMPFYWYQVINAVRGNDFWRMSVWIRSSWLVPCAILDVLNILWFRKMLLGAIKVLHARKDRPVEREHLQKRD